MITTNQTVYDDEIDLLELLRVLFNHKLSILLCTLVFGVGAFVIAITTPNTYQADVLVSSSQGGGMGSALVSQYGGLAAMAGIDLGSGDAGLESVLALLKSRKFIISFINEEGLKPVLFPDKWDEETKVWFTPAPGMRSRIKSALVGSANDEVLDPKPSDLGAYGAFSKIMTVSEDKKSGLVTIKVDSENPVMAANWANKIVVRLNAYLKDEAISQSDQNIRYLEQEIVDTPLVEFKTALYELVETEAKSKMFANVQKEYALKVIDPAVVPEGPIKPKRSLILILGVLLGFMVGCAQGLVRGWMNRKVAP